MENQNVNKILVLINQTIRILMENQNVNKKLKLQFRVLNSKLLKTLSFEISF